MAHEELIARYEAGGEKLSLAVRGLTREDMLALPDAAADVGKWSIQQVVIHLLDSDLILTDRLKRMISEDNPTLLGYNESRYIEELFCNDQSAEDAITIVNLNRHNFARVLRKLIPEAFLRTGQHNERGTITVGSYLQKAVEHLEHHVDFIHRKRANMGKELW